MRRILKTERLGDGVSVTWDEEEGEMTQYYPFSRLIDLKVNALDILQNPGNYGIDEKTREVRYIAFCQPSRHPELHE